jgi:glycosyltransferase involved in cell wall biosynthesis
VISVVVCSIVPAKFTALRANLALVLRGVNYETVGIHDATSLCEGYNRGLARSRGEVTIFCHDDIEILDPNFARKLEGRLAAYDALGVAGTTRMVDMGWANAGQPWIHGVVAHGVASPYEVAMFGAEVPVVPAAQGMDGLFIATRREVAEAVRFDEETFDGWHGYDSDFTYRCYLAGYRLGIMTDVPILHASTGRDDPSWPLYAQRFAAKHRATLAQGRGEVRYLRREVWDKAAIVASCTDAAALAAATRKLRDGGL